MAGFVKRYVPGVSSDPVGLAFSLLTNKNPAARSALLGAAAGITLAPLDRLFQVRERSIYESAPYPSHPIVFVCGPPRSGTTLVAQYLIHALKVDYFSNLCSLFPRSPILARKVFRHTPPTPKGQFRAFYGRTGRLSGPNDGLFVWDRWLGTRRGEVPESLLPGAETSMQKFFGAMQQQSDRMVVNKVNRLAACADLVAPTLPNSYFVYVHRKRPFLAQSLLIARQQICRDEHRPTESDIQIVNSATPLKMFAAKWNSMRLSERGSKRKSDSVSWSFPTNSSAIDRKHCWRP